MLPRAIYNNCKPVSRWWFQMFFIFTPTGFGEMIQFDSIKYVFSKWLGWNRCLDLDRCSTHTESPLWFQKDSLQSTVTSSPCQTWDPERAAALRSAFPQEKGPKTPRMKECKDPEKGLFGNESPTSNHQPPGDILVFFGGGKSQRPWKLVGWEMIRLPF